MNKSRIRATIVIEICLVSSSMARARFNVASVLSKILRCSVSSALAAASAVAFVVSPCGAVGALAFWLGSGVFDWRPLGNAGAFERSGFAACGLLTASICFSGRSDGLAAGASSFNRASTAASRGVSQSIVFLDRREADRCVRVIVSTERLLD